MADVFNKEKRSQIMAAITSKNTQPELKIRKALHHKGFRYRLHDKKLPGSPDLVFRRYQAVIFIHGCFWHGHDCPVFRLPSTNREYWKSKINRNQIRDAKVRQLIMNKGWRIMTVWECSLRGKYRKNFEDLLAEIEFWLFSDCNFEEIRGDSN